MALFLGLAPTIFMAFQHCLVILGQVVVLANVLIPLMGGGNNEKAKVSPRCHCALSSQLHRSVVSRSMLTRLGIQLRIFGVFLFVGWFWLVAHILSVTHAYHHRAPEAQIYCRTERSGLLTS